MTEFLTAALGFILAMLAHDGSAADRNRRIAALLLVGVVSGVPAAVDVALTLALLATFASIAFVKKGMARLEADAPKSTEGV